MKQALELRYTPSKFNLKTNTYTINFSDIEDKVADIVVMKNITIHFAMRIFTFANELADADANIIGWEYVSENATLIINFDEDNCQAFYN